MPPRLLPRRPGSLYRASRAENHLPALARDARIAEGTCFYVDRGIADRLLAGNRAFAQAMAARPLAYELHEVPGTHSWEFWDRRLPVFPRVVEARIHPSARGRARRARQRRPPISCKAAAPPRSWPPPRFSRRIGAAIQAGSRSGADAAGIPSIT